jgi:hypothetical protein
LVSLSSLLSLSNKIIQLILALQTSNLSFNEKKCKTIILLEEKEERSESCCCCCCSFH